MSSALEDLEKIIKSHSESGGIAIIAFTILGFPNIKISTHAVKILRNSQIAAFETAVPVKRGWSVETNVVIRNACLTALNHHVNLEKVLNLYQDFRPNIYVVYRGAFGMPLKQALKKFQGKVDAILPEWGIKSPESMSRLCQKHNVKFVDAVSPMMDWTEVRRRVLCSQGFVYLSCAPMTGGELLPLDVIRSTISRVKEIRPQIPVCCGFGIKSPNDVRTIGSIEGCDGIIIGTAFLEALSQGIDSFSKFVRKVMLASRNLKKKDNT